MNPQSAREGEVGLAKDSLPLPVITAAVQFSVLGAFSHALSPLPSFQGCRRVGMLFHPGPVQDSENSERWGVILLLSSSRMSVQPLQPFRIVTRLGESQK